MFGFGSSASAASSAETLKEQVRKWTSELRKEMRGMDSQIRRALGRRARRRA